MNKVKGHITTPFLLLILTGLLLVFVTIFLLYRFLPNFSYGVQYDIYSITSTASNTKICTNFNSSSISSIVLTTSTPTNSITETFPSNQITTREFLTNENCFIYTSGYSIFGQNTISPEIISGYIVSNNGQRQAIKVVGNNYVLENTTQIKTTISYLNLSVSPYIVIQPNTISVTAITNIKNPEFSFFVNNSQVAGCQEILENSCSVEIANFTNNTNVEILVYASNSTITTSKKAFIFATT